jgi:hypothetical protein
LLVPVMTQWHSLPTEMHFAYYGVLTWLLSALALASLAWCIRDAVSFVKLGRQLSGNRSVSPPLAADVRRQPKPAGQK